MVEKKIITSQNFTEMFPLIEVFDTDNQKDVEFKDIWEKSKNNLVMVHFLRRFG